MLDPCFTDMEGYPRHQTHVCDSCQVSPSSIYCHNDSAFLCTACDHSVHSANLIVSRHKRVRLCDLCENAPASVTCEADKASLCVDCDGEIHSANPLAHRHIRVPVFPLSSSLSEFSTYYQDEFPSPVFDIETPEIAGEEARKVMDETEIDSWLILDQGNDDVLSHTGYTCFEDPHRCMQDELERLEEILGIRELKQQEPSDIAMTVDVNGDIGSAPLSGQSVRSL